MSLKATCKTLEKVLPDEEIFILRAKDQIAPKLVILWIAENLHASDQKLREAFECAMRMRKYPYTKAAD